MIQGIFLHREELKCFNNGRLVMYRVFDPTPCLTEGCTLEFDNDKYHVVKNRKRIKSGDVVQVDEDLMKLQHNPEKMMLMLARIRAVVRGAMNEDIRSKILEITNERGPVPFTIEGEAGIPGGIR